MEYSFMELKSLWEEMAKVKESGEKDKRDYKAHPLYASAQKRSMSYYGKHGESRPLKDFIEDPSLK